MCTHIVRPLLDSVKGTRPVAVEPVELRMVPPGSRRYNRSMPERRAGERANGSDRRDIRRPSLRLNLALLAFAVAATFVARHQRERIDAAFTRVFDRSAAGPAELDLITAELAGMALAGDALRRELEARLAHIGNLRSDVYLSIDVEKQTLSLKSGNEVVRTARVRIDARAAAKGSFAVAGKKDGAIMLPNGRAIRSSLAPGAFAVPEADLKAIWDQVGPETRVYVF